MGNKRILIMGSTGSGKSTLGKQLAQKWNLPCTDLDDLYWLPGWQQRSKEDFEGLIEKAVSQEAWILCGNYRKFFHVTLPKATMIIWLDLPFHTLLWRIVKRSVLQAFRKQPLCNGNYQTFSQFFWLVKHLFKTYSRRRKTIRELKVNIPIIRLTSSRQVEQFKDGHGDADGKQDH